MSREMQFDDVWLAEHADVFDPNDAVGRAQAEIKAEAAAKAPQPPAVSPKPSPIAARFKTQSQALEEGKAAAALKEAGQAALRGATEAPRRILLGGVNFLEQALENPGMPSMFAPGGAPSEVLNTALPRAAQPETAVGRIAAELLATGLTVGAGTVAGGPGVASFLGSRALDAFVDYMQDPGDPNLANLAAELAPSIKESGVGKTLVDFLATTPENSAQLNRLRNVLVGQLIGTPLEAIIRGAPRVFDQFKRVLQDEQGTVAATNQGVLPEVNKIVEAHNAPKPPGEAVGVTLQGGQTTPTKGFSVDIAPELTHTVPGRNITPEDVDAFAQKARASGAPLEHEAAAIGTYYDPALDTSEIGFTAIIPERFRAERAAKRTNQRSMVDVETGQVIETGGTGAPVKDLPPISQRLAEATEPLVIGQRPTNPEITAGADAFIMGRGIQAPPVSRLTSIDVERAKRAAEEFDVAGFRPDDPGVRGAYDAFAEEIAEQYDHATKVMGYNLEPWTNPGQPYADSAEMIRDVAENKHLYFVTGDDLPEGHPLVRDAGDGLTFGDKFRALHDLFAHAGPGNRFGPIDEENAWRAHMRMFGPLARKALTAETRGQNSWANFGRHLRMEEIQAAAKGEPGLGSLPERLRAKQAVDPLPDQFISVDNVSARTVPDAAIELTNRYRAAYDVGSPQVEKEEVVGAAAIALGANTREKFERRLAYETGKSYTDEELDTLYTRSQGQFEALVDRIFYQPEAKGAPTAVEAVQGALKQGEFAKNWYADVRPTVATFAGSDDAGLFMDLLTTLSAHQPAEVATTQAVELYKAWKIGGTFPEIVDRARKHLGETDLQALRKTIAGRTKNPAKAEAMLARELAKRPTEPAIFTPEQVSSLQNLYNSNTVRFDASPRVSALRANLDGDTDTVTADSWLGEALFGKPQLETPEYRFARDFVRDLARDHSISPVEMQSAIWVAKRIVDEGVIDPARNPKLKVLAEIIKNKFIQAASESRFVLPPGLDAEGATRLSTIWFLSSVSAGALYGGTYGDSIESRLRNALQGAFIGGLGALGTTGAVKTLLGVKSVSKEAQEAFEAVTAASNFRKIVQELKTVDAGIKDFRANRVRPAQQLELFQQDGPHDLQHLGQVYTSLVDEFRRGVRKDPVVFAEGLDLARHTFSDDYIKDLAPGTPYSDAEIAAFRIILDTSAQQVRKAAQLAKSNGYSDDSMTALAEELWRFGAVDARFLGAAAEAGRTERMFREAGRTEYLRNLSQVLKDADSGLSGERLVQMILNVGTAPDLHQAVRATTRGNLASRIFIETFISGLLSAGRTFVRNVFGGAGLLLATDVENVGAAVLARLGKGGEGSVVPGEVTRRIYGQLQSLGEAWRLFNDLAFDPYTDYLRAVSDGGKVGRMAPAITAENLELTGVVGRAVDVAGTAIRTAGRGVYAIDQAVRAIAREGVIHSRAWREAVVEANLKGLTGRAHKEAVEDAYARILASPPDSILQAAEREAMYVTLSSPLPEGVLADIGETIGKNPILRVAAPFYQVVTNAALVATERLPFAPTRKAVRGALIGGTPEERNLALSRMAFGASVMALAGYYAVAGRVTGRAPENEEIDYVWRLTGRRPYHFGFDTNGDGEPDVWINYDNVAEPLGAIIGMAADLAHIAADVWEARERGDFQTWAEYTEVTKAVIQVIANQLNNKTWVKGLSGWLAAMVTPERYGGKQVADFAASVVPFSSLLRSTTTAIDPEVKEARTVVDKFLARFPFASKSVPPKREPLEGNPIMYSPGVGADLIPPEWGVARGVAQTFNPIYVSRAPDEKANHVYTEMTLNQMTGLRLKPLESVQGLPLTNDERDFFMQIRAGRDVTVEGVAHKGVMLGGKTLKDALYDLTQKDIYLRSTDGPDGRKTVLMRQVIDAYTKLAIQATRKAFPNLNADIRAALREKTKLMQSVPGGTHGPVVDDTDPDLE